MTIAKQDMRQVMSQFATGVCVVSTRRDDGTPVGTTVNAVSSVSLEPPLLLVCLAHDSETLAVVQARAHFTVSILAEGQQAHSHRFAAKGEQAQSHEVEFREHGSGPPCLPDALATVACRVSAMHHAGDHMIVIGEALSTSSAPTDVAPLLFFRGSYSRLERERPPALKRPARRRRVAVLERIG
ncbi:MAG TPA: flavin reductase family protein [Solirubrobacteraceae bacterium]|jgi:flavin reductase (DIM6/NTAB) family NADH-FMN oxidoreductase RutF|nr:flavin reductase family protein [Solirubrobacteraceae bacterium]